MTSIKDSDKSLCLSQYFSFDLWRMGPRILPTAREFTFVIYLLVYRPNVRHYIGGMVICGDHSDKRNLPKFPLTLFKPTQRNRGRQEEES
jgi:hypothetical protein